MQRLLCASGLLAFGLSSSLAFGQHEGDINPSLQAAAGDLWKIRTNAWAEGGVLIPDERIFLATFGDSGFPTFTSDPGFDAPPGTFVAGTRVGFHAPQGLLRWTGKGVEPVTDQRLEVSFLTLSTLIGPEPNEGFDLAVQSNGGWHRHFSFEITTEDGGELKPDIFVLPLTLYSTDPALIDSDLFWIVFNYQSDPREAEHAVGWLDGELVEPSCAEDLDFDHEVGASDLASLLGAWGPAPSNGYADLDADGDVGASDLAIILGAWGSCG
jgi:hypothetical protein